MICPLCKSGSTKSFGNDHAWCMDCKSHEYRGHTYTRKEWDELMNNESVMFKHEEIRNEQDHAQALERLDALMDFNPQEGSAESDELEALAGLIEGYEQKHFPMDHPEVQ